MFSERGWADTRGWILVGIRGEEEWGEGRFGGFEVDGLREGRVKRRGGLGLDDWTDSCDAGQPGLADDMAGSSRSLGQPSVDDLPDRISDALKAARDFPEYQELRKFRFLHMFSGKEDVLGNGTARRLAD